ncbi:hypothetical protein ABV409_12735 [Flagellimonas sp. DF-77]|uniref:hypothetical protein n=1 Tax=Flagellimonas algarum TaxID=3230298 RepID=UPI003399C3C2
MDSNKYIDDISEIKELMNRSSRFLSLSGLSGILAGIYALAGAWGAYVFLFPKTGEYLVLDSWNFRLTVFVLLSVAILSTLTAFILTRRKARQNNEKVWGATTRRLLFHFLIPLVTGGIYILIKLKSQHYGLTASLMLIFYGMALVNASKYTLGNVRYLGLAEIVLGLLCAALPGYGFWFWVIGFGILHIVYGSLIYFGEGNKG